MTNRLMNIAAKKAGNVTWMPPLLVTTEMDWWWCTMSMMMAKITMPTISKNTPVLLIVATSLTLKMLSIVITTNVMAATAIWSCSASALRCQPMLSRAGKMVKGSVTTTAVTVKMPAKM